MEINISSRHFFGITTIYGSAPPAPVFAIRRHLADFPWSARFVYISGEDRNQLLVCDPGVSNPWKMMH